MDQFVPLALSKFNTNLYGCDVYRIMDAQIRQNEKILFQKHNNIHNNRRGDRARKLNSYFWCTLSTRMGTRTITRMRKREKKYTKRKTLFERKIYNQNFQCV